MITTEQTVYDELLKQCFEGLFAMFDHRGSNNHSVLTLNTPKKMLNTGQKVIDAGRGLPLDGGRPLPVLRPSTIASFCPANGVNPLGPERGVILSGFSFAHQTRTQLVGLSYRGWLGNRARRDRHTYRPSGAGKRRAPAFGVLVFSFTFLSCFTERMTRSKCLFLAADSLGGFFLLFLPFSFSFIWRSRPEQHQQNARQKQAS